MKKEVVSTLRGSFLVAMPSITDSYFKHSVILMCEHAENGSMGFVINNINAKVQAGNIFSDMKLDFKPEQGTKPLHVGGPVGMDELFILHDEPHNWGESFKISGDIGLSLSHKMIEEIVEGHGPQTFSLVVGYAVWSPGQLDRELRGNSWLVTPAKKDIVFECPTEKVWIETLNSMGINPARLSSCGGNA